MPAFTYRDAQLAAREAAGSLSQGAVARIRQELKLEAERLAAQLAALPVGTPAQTAAALEASVKLIKRLEARLLAVGTQAIAEQRAVSFAEVATLWQRAALETAKLQHVPQALMGAIRQPPITLLGSYEALGGAAAHWKTALQSAVQAGGADLDAIVRRGLSQQVSPEELARGLRAYVVGAEPFHEAFAGEAFARVQDLRTGVPVHLREAGRKMAFNARRIAYSEIHNARAEAEITHFAIDPMIGAVRWTLSPFRGEVDVPDACDVLATSDFYGLGAGIYPIGKVPPPPHPFDRSIAAWTPVLTSEGWRRVDQVPVGAQVWTHRRRWGRVTESLAGRRTGTWLELRTRDGRVLTITADHPVLLASGAWRLAGALRVGDRLAVSRDRPRDLLDPLGAIRPGVAPPLAPVEDQKRPAGGLEGRRLAAVLSPLPAGTVPAAMNLDRQLQRRDREIEIELPERIEGRHGESARGAQANDASLVGAESLALIDGAGLLGERAGGVRRATPVVHPHQAGPTLPFGAVHALADEDIGFGDPPAWDAPLDEPGAHRTAVDVEPLGDRVLADSLRDVPALDLCAVELVDVRSLHVHLRRWCLTVANDKSFVAGGIVIHNCERMPVVRSVTAAGTAKPYPLRALAPTSVRIPARFRATTTAAHEARVLKHVEQVMTAAEGWALQNPLQQVMLSGLTEGQTPAKAVSLHRAALTKTVAAAAVAPPPSAITAPILEEIPPLAPPPPAPVKLGTFTVPGELAAQPGAIDQVKALIKQHQNKSPYALGKLEALGVDVSTAKASQAAKAAKKAALAEAQLAADVASERASLQAMGLELAIGDVTPSPVLLEQLRAIRKAATAAADQAYDVAASAASFAQSTFPGSVTTGFLEAAFKTAALKIDLLDQAAVTKLLSQVPSSRQGSKLVAAVKKAKASAASKAAAQTKALKAADELKITTGVVLAPDASLASINAAKKVLSELDGKVAQYAASGHAGAIATARHNAKKKLVALGATPESVAGLEAKWVTAPLGPATPAPAIAAATNAPDVLDPAVVLHKQIGPQAGSNPGGRFVGTDGVTRYVKFYTDPAQAHSEALANALYRDLGLKAPKSGVGVTTDGKTFFASEILHTTGTVGKGPFTAAEAAEILEGFAADVLMANWDAVGTGLDNVVRLAGGGIARIDQGGAFLFRAQGGLKSAVKGYGAKGLKELSEFDSLYTENAYYRKVFDTAGVKPESLGSVLTDAVQRITTLEQAHGGWAKYVDELVPSLGAADRATIADMLTARSALLRARAKVQIPPVPAKKSIAAFDELPFQLTEAQAAGVALEGPAAKPFYFQSGKTSLAKLEAGIDLKAAPTEFGIEAFPLTASPGYAKHSSAIVSQFLLQPTRPLVVQAGGLTQPAAVKKAVHSAIEGAIGKPIGKLTPAQVAEALREKGFDAVLVSDWSGVQQALVLDPRTVKLVKTKAKVPFTTKAVPWQPDDPAALAALKAQEEAAEAARLAALPVDPTELEVPGLPPPPTAITGRRGTAGLEEAGSASHLMSDRERRMLTFADENLDKQASFAALGGTREKVREAFERAGRHSGYQGNDDQKGLHNLVTELAGAIAKREGITAKQYAKAEKAIVGFIKDWSGSSDSRGAEVLKLLAERLRPGNLRTAKAGNGFFNHEARPYATFVRRAREHLARELAGTDITVEQFTAAYDAYVMAQRAVLRIAHPGGTVRVSRGVDKTTFFRNQGLTRKQFGSSIVVSHNSLSSFSAKSGFSGVKFRADVPIDDIELHYLLIRRSEFWGEAEVWLIGRPRRMEITGG